MTIKKNDFVELEYTGSLDEGVFDTTDVEIAKQAKIFDEKTKYQPVIICVGQGQILKGIDDFIEGKEPGKFSIELEAKDAFGKKDAKLMRMIPASKFRDQNIQPMPGLRLNIDGSVGVVRSVNGGRIIVDFNHPLAGRDVKYDIEVKRIVSDKKEQVESLIKSLIGMSMPVDLQENKAQVSLPDKLPEEFTKKLSEKIKELTDVDVEFLEKESQNQSGKSEPEKKD